MKWGSSIKFNPRITGYGRHCDTLSWSAPIAHKMEALLSSLSCWENWGLTAHTVSTPEIVLGWREVPLPKDTALRWRGGGSNLQLIGRDYSQVQVPAPIPANFQNHPSCRAPLSAQASFLYSPVSCLKSQSWPPGIWQERRYRFPPLSKIWNLP